MSEFFQALQDAFPILKSYPLLMARLLLAVLVLGAIYAARGSRKRLCDFLASKLSNRLFSQERWLYVYRDSTMIDQWKYYTSHTTGGRVGDDIIWTLVNWPSLKPKDSFRVNGAVGMLDGVHESQAKLQGRWHIAHDPDGDHLIGVVHARGLTNALYRATAKVLMVVGSI